MYMSSVLFRYCDPSTVVRDNIQQQGSETIFQLPFWFCEKNTFAKATLLVASFIRILYVVMGLYQEVFSLLYFIRTILYLLVDPSIRRVLTNVLSKFIKARQFRTLNSGLLPWFEEAWADSRLYFSFSLPHIRIISWKI